MSWYDPKRTWYNTPSWESNIGFNTDTLGDDTMSPSVYDQAEENRFLSFLKESAKNPDLMKAGLSMGNNYANAGLSAYKDMSQHANPQTIMGLLAQAGPGQSPYQTFAQPIGLLKRWY